MIATEPATQTVVVGKGDDLLRGPLHGERRELDQRRRPDGEPMRAQVKIRNKHIAAPATLHPASDARVWRFISIRRNVPLRRVRLPSSTRAK